MNIFSYIFAGAFIALPTIAMSASMQLDLDATANTARPFEGAAAISADDLIAIDFGVGEVKVDVIDGVYQAYRFGDNPIVCDDDDDCGDGWTVSWLMFDESGVFLEGFGIEGTYATSSIALGVAQASGTKTFNIASEGTYFFGIGDGLDSRFDNAGGVSLSIDYQSPTQVPLPASGLLLLGALGGSLVVRRKTK